MASTDTTFTSVVIDSTLAVAGVLSGQPRLITQALTATGAVTITSGLLTLNHASTIIAATMTTAPTAGDLLVIINTSASGTAAHTVKTPSGVTFDGTNNTATLNAPDEALILVATSATRWRILVNLNAVAFSST